MPAPPPMREERLAQGAAFLADSRIAGSSAEQKRGFLRRKGLSDEEIDLAVTRHREEHGRGASSSTALVAKKWRGGALSPVATNMPGWGGPAAMMPPPAPVVVPQAQTPWWLLLLSGLGFGSSIALFLRWLIRKLAPRLFPALLPPAHGHPGPGYPAAGPIGPGGPLPARGAPFQEGAPGGSSGSNSSGSPVSGLRSIPAVRLQELTAEMRKHVEQTQEATAELRRAMEQQQRQYSATSIEFSRKFTESSRRKPIAGSQRIEISPESLQVLRHLVAPEVGSGGSSTLPGGEGSDAGAAAAAARAASLQEWFRQVEASLGRLLRKAGSKAEGRKQLQTVSMIVHNLVESPGDAKYREVSTTVARFRDTLGTPESGAAELLRLAGFEARGQAFVFPADRSLDEAERARDFLQSALRDSDARWEQAVAAEAAADPPPPLPPPAGGPAPGDSATNGGGGNQEQQAAMGSSSQEPQTGG